MQKRVQLTSHVSSAAATCASTGNGLLQLKACVAATCADELLQWKFGH
jgi:hypothetical protein